MIIIPPADNSGRARTSATVFKVYIGALAVSMLGCFYYLYAIYTLQTSPSGIVAFRQASIVFLMAEAVKLSVLVICAITFIFWFRRAYHNLHKVGCLGLSWSEGWAAGSWFVPFMNLAVPYTIMKEIWYRTQEVVLKEGETVKRGSIVGWWWALFIAAGFATALFRTPAGNEQGLENLRMTVTAEIFSDLFYIPAAILCIRMIRQVSVFEDRLFHHNWKDYFDEQSSEPTFRQ